MAGDICIDADRNGYYWVYAHIVAVPKKMHVNTAAIIVRPDKLSPHGLNVINVKTWGCAVGVIVRQLAMSNIV